MTTWNKQGCYFGELTGDKPPFNGAVSQDEKLAIFLFKSMFGGSLEGNFDYFGIDGDAFCEGYEDMEKLVDTSSARPYLHADVGADYPMNQEYSSFAINLKDLLSITGKSIKRKTAAGNKSRRLSS